MSLQLLLAFLVDTYILKKGAKTIRIGVIHYKDAKIQLLDLPGIIEGAAHGKGRGRQVKQRYRIVSYELKLFRLLLLVNQVI